MNDGATGTPDVEDVAYRRACAGALLARMYRPTGAGAFPAVVNIHGGAWSGSDRLHEEPIDQSLVSTDCIRWVKSNQTNCELAATWRARCINRRSPDTAKFASIGVCKICGVGIRARQGGAANVQGSATYVCNERSFSCRVIGGAQANLRVCDQAQHRNLERSAGQDTVAAAIQRLDEKIGKGLTLSACGA